MPVITRIVAVIMMIWATWARHTMMEYGYWFGIILWLSAVCVAVGWKSYK